VACGGLSRQESQVHRGLVAGGPENVRRVSSLKPARACMNWAERLPTTAGRFTQAGLDNDVRETGKGDLPCPSLVLDSDNE